MVLYPNVAKLELMSPPSTFRGQAHFDMRQRLRRSAIINDALDEATNMCIQGLPCGPSAELHKVIQQHKGSCSETEDKGLCQIITLTHLPPNHGPSLLLADSESLQQPPRLFSF
jgi:hypothetical protein